jgi:hypothetical protein
MDAALAALGLRLPAEVISAIDAAYAPRPLSDSGH